MSDDELYDLADNDEWPAFIKHLDTLAVGGINEQILFVHNYSGCCVSMVAALRDAPAPVWKAIIEAALRAGLDLHAILTRVGGGKWTVLHYAACYSGDEVVTFLACLCPSALDMKDYANMTPLEHAKARNRPSSLLAALTQVS